MRIYIGADPTSNSLHLSHAKNYMLLEEFRLLGHEVIILFGDFTAQIGDPTDRSDARPQISEEKVRENVKYIIQNLSKISGRKCLICIGIRKIPNLRVR